MRFSECFGVERTEADDWFDPLLSADTRLFVDPFQVFLDESEGWGDAHDELVEFFNEMLKLVAKSKGRPGSAHWKAARRMLVFPEPAEFCLGYGVTPLGSGTGDEIRDEILEGARLTVFDLDRGSVDHFEELLLFGRDVGADRIGDVVCNVLKARFIDYTLRVIEGQQLETEPVLVPRARWDAEHLVWRDEKVALPLNPFTGRAVILTPERFLRKLPTFDQEDFWDWSWVNENETLRESFNYDVGRNVDAKTITRLARTHPDLVQRYIDSKAGQQPDPYDIRWDPSGEVDWYDAGLHLASISAFSFFPTRANQFCKWVLNLLEGFQHNIEQQDGWRLLWTSKNNPRNERTAQAAFRTAVWQMCREHDVDFSGEPNAGRGPVDFKFSKGWKRRALVEIKLMNNSQFWDGLTVQTRQYLKSEGIRCGYFVALGFRDSDFSEERKKRVHGLAKEASDEAGVKITPIIVDARIKRSASKKKAGDP